MCNATTIKDFSSNERKISFHWKSSSLWKRHFISCQQHEKSTCLYQDCIIWTHLEDSLYGSLKTFSIKSWPLSYRKVLNDSGSIAACEWVSKAWKDSPPFHQSILLAVVQFYMKNANMPAIEAPISLKGLSSSCLMGAVMMAGGGNLPVCRSKPK